MRIRLLGGWEHIFVSRITTVCFQGRIYTVYRPERIHNYRTKENSEVRGQIAAMELLYILVFATPATRLPLDTNFEAIVLWVRAGS